jgi:hypothetical protein
MNPLQGFINLKSGNVAFYLKCGKPGPLFCSCGVQHGQIAPALLGTAHHIARIVEWGWDFNGPCFVTYYICFMIIVLFKFKVQ